MSVFKKAKEQEAAAPVTKATLTKSIVTTASILTVLSVAVTAYITQAWFSMNRQVDNTGVHMNVQTSPNMFIADADTPNAGTAITYAQFSALNAATALTQVSFNDPTTVGSELLLVPVTRTVPQNTPASSVGLYCLYNPSIIDRFSGVKTSGNYDLRAVASNSNPQYYLEHKVLIASTDDVLPAAALTATFSAYSVGGDPETNKTLTVGAANPTAYDTTNKYAYDHAQLFDNGTLKADVSNMYQYAASVDFYLTEVTKSDFSTAGNAGAITVSSSDYVDTLNLAQKDDGSWNILSTSAGTAAPKASVILKQGADPAQDQPRDNISIPCNSASDNDTVCAYLVTMRFYFDGALLAVQDLDNTAPDNNTAYVHSAYLDAASMPNLYIQFTATEPTPSA